MMDAGIWKKYLALMESLGNTLDQLAELERTKAKAVSQGDLPGVEECMKKEQVVSLSLRGMDQKRDKMLAEMGLAGVRLRDLAAHAPKELYQETKAAAEKLRQQYELYQASSKVAMDTLECNLRTIEQLQKARSVPPEEDRPHQSDFTI